VGQGDTLSFEANRTQSGYYWCSAQNTFNTTANASGYLEVHCKWIPVSRWMVSLNVNCKKNTTLHIVQRREQRWRSGKGARLPPIWPGCDSGPVPYVGWVCCLFSSKFAQMVFLCVLSIPKNQHLKFQSTRIEDSLENQLGLMWLSLLIL